MQSFIAIVISTTFGSGYFPIAPGTVGSAIAIIAAWFLSGVPVAALFAFITVAFLLGVWTSTICEKYWQRHDPGQINWDEVVGMLISVIALPRNLFLYILAFFLFRLFDIIKPQPAQVSQKLPRGWGVMTDDIIAGVYTNLSVQILYWLYLKNHMPF